MRRSPGRGRVHDPRRRAPDVQEPVLVRRQALRRHRRGDRRRRGADRAAGGARRGARHRARRAEADGPVPALPRDRPVGQEGGGSRHRGDRRPRARAVQQRRRGGDAGAAHGARGERAGAAPPLRGAVRAHAGGRRDREHRLDRGRPLARARREDQRAARARRLGQVAGLARRESRRPRRRLLLVLEGGRAGLHDALVAPGAAARGAREQRLPGADRHAAARGLPQDDDRQDHRLDRVADEPAPGDAARGGATRSPSSRAMPRAT